MRSRDRNIINTNANTATLKITTLTPAPAPTIPTNTNISGKANRDPLGAELTTIGLHTSFSERST